ncbi:hypothetical protein IGI04_002354 [Brassica rapa subsp. trilocularis]|uniref:Uncharacterized protein n=1 Tax=Brassica rapa subsp. trilocularis TaxID=1813537 RepID=A0ABQ7NVB2_BRACM|nr:hypothetical protein IGI04_002354 [Brassica rapa subsp. trilocularis]
MTRARYTNQPRSPQPTSDVLPPMPPSDFLLQPLMAEAAAMDIFFRSSTVVLLFCVLPITLLLCFSPAVTNMLHIMEEADRRKHRWFCLHGGGFEGTNDFNNTAVTQIVYRSLSNSIAALNQELATKQNFASKTSVSGSALVHVLLLCSSRESPRLLGCSQTSFPDCIAS